MASGSALRASRNDELISAKKRWRRRIAKVVVEIAPLRIDLLNQRNLPSAPPFLDRFFPRDRRRHLAVLLKPNKLRAAMIPRKAFELALTMLIRTLNQVRRHAKIQRPIPPVRHKVNSDELVPQHAHTVAASPSVVIPGQCEASNPKPMGRQSTVPKTHRFRVRAPRAPE